ncbi:DUF7172 family protein [Rhodococcus aetherivorans]
MAVMVCTTEQFTHDGGVMGLAASRFPRVVAITRTVAENDGALTTETQMGSAAPYWTVAEDLRSPFAHRILIDQELHWANTFPCEVKVIPVIRRARRYIRTITNCLIYVRDSYTVRVGPDSPVPVQAVEPDLSAYTSEWGGGRIQDVSSGLDWYSRWIAAPEYTTWMDTLTVPEGHSVSLRCRVGVILPNGFQSAQTSKYPEVRVHHNTLALIALPSPQETS